MNVALAKSSAHEEPIQTYICIANSWHNVPQIIRLTAATLATAAGLSAELKMELRSAINMQANRTTTVKTIGKLNRTTKS